MTYADGWHDARAWLEREPSTITERPPHGLVARRVNPGRGAREVGVTLETLHTIKAGAARDRLRKLAEWKARGESRWTVVFVPRDVADTELVGLPWVDQIVRWPVENPYPSTS